MVESNTDDWNATSKTLATTGSSVLWIGTGVLALLTLGGALTVIRRRGAGSHAAHTGKTTGNGRA